MFKILGCIERVLHKLCDSFQVLETSPYLGDNVLGILRAVQHQLLGDIGQRDPGVREVDHPDASLDDVMTEPDDQRVRSFCQELGAELFQDLVKPGEVAQPHSWIGTV